MMNGYRYGCGGFGNFGNFGIWHFIIPILVLGIIIYFVYKLFNQDRQNINNSLLNELNNKYINGELTDEEYLQKKRVINKNK